MSTLFLNDPPTMTLVDLGAVLDNGATLTEVSPRDISLNLNAGEIRVGNRALPLKAESVEAIDAFVQIPTAFRKRMPEDLAEHVVNELLRRHNSITPAYVKANDDTLFSIRERGAKNIDPTQVVALASRVITPSALVTNFINEPDQFSFDVIAPHDYERAIGGDRRVGDLAHGGLRFGQDLKQGLAPWVSKLIYRLLCTNGMEVADKALKIDARGGTVDEVLAELELAAERAFSQVEQDMEHFYAMRDEIVAQPTQMMSRMAAEHRMSDRLRLRLIDAIPTIEPANGETISMFDLVNLATNQANDPSISSNGVRRSLQRFGGQIVTVHADRCRVCASRLN